MNGGIKPQITKHIRYHLKIFSLLLKPLSSTLSTWPNHPPLYSSNIILIPSYLSLISFLSHLVWPQNPLLKFSFNKKKSVSIPFIIKNQEYIWEKKNKTSKRNKRTSHHSVIQWIHHHRKNNDKLITVRKKQRLYSELGRVSSWVRQLSTLLRKPWPSR